MSEEDIKKLKSMYETMQAAKEGFLTGKSDGRTFIRPEEVILLITEAVVYLLEKDESTSKEIQNLRGRFPG